MAKAALKKDSDREKIRSPLFKSSTSKIVELLLLIPLFTRFFASRSLDGAVKAIANTELDIVNVKKIFEEI